MSIQNLGDNNFLKLGSDDRIDRKTTKRVLSIDSLFRKDYQSTKSTDFMYTLPDPINKVTSLKISSIEFPNSWYTFSSENGSSSFVITLYNCPTPLNTPQIPPVMKHVIVIPDGNYRSDILVDRINFIFTNTKKGLDYLRFEISDINSKCEIRMKTISSGNLSSILLDPTQDSNFYFTVDFAVPSKPLYKTAGWMLGFKQPFYTVRINTTNPKTVIDTTVIDKYYWYLQSESSYGSSLQNYIFLEIDDFNRNSTSNTFFSKTINDSYIGNNIMGRITVTSGMNTIVTMDGGDLLFKTREYFGPIRLEKLHIRLIDKFGDPVNLEGNDYSFMLEIEQLYSK